MSQASDLISLFEELNYIDMDDFPTLEWLCHERLGALTKNDVEIVRARDVKRRDQIIVTQNESSAPKWTYIKVIRVEKVTVPGDEYREADIGGYKFKLPDSERFQGISFIGDDGDGFGVYPHYQVFRIKKEWIKRNKK